jgi:ubiquinone/menaquinone biosynthesis C-methylase UbiE
MSNMVCPWWMGYVLINPIRKIIQNPDKILSDYLSKGMNVLEIGSGMGFFSIPIAKMVGENGYVLSIDLQKKMLESLTKRVKKANLSNIIQTHHCSAKSLLIDNLSDKFDFALAFAVVHEIPDQNRLFKEIYAALKKDGLLLIAEPKGHVSENELEKSVSLAEKEGFHIIQKPEIKGSRSVLLNK